MYWFCGFPPDFTGGLWGKAQIISVFRSIYVYLALFCVYSLWSLPDFLGVMSRAYAVHDSLCVLNLFATVWLPTLWWWPMVVRVSTVFILTRLTVLRGGCLGLSVISGVLFFIFNFLWCIVCGRAYNVLGFSPMCFICRWLPYYIVVVLLA